MAVQIQYRRGEAAEWTSVNPTLALGEPGYEVDTGRIKIGDGVTAWNDLIYTAANSLLNGEGPPSDVNDGKIGDFYIDTLNDSIYGPKTETGWGTGVDFIVSTINGLLDVDTSTTPPLEGEALIWNPTGGDGTGAWVPGPAGAEASGAVGQIQYNDGASPTPGLAASADLTWDDTGKVLGVGGDVDLDDGGTYTTTLQTITATANRTISFPDATGTVGLVAGSSGQLIYNSAGANAGASTLTYDGSILTSTGRFINSYNATASSPAKTFTGTWFSGGTATTTKPQVLIEPSGTTSTAWSTSGTGLGVNAASGFAGNLLDLQVGGTSQLSVSSLGSPLVGLTSAYNSGTAKGYYFASGNLSIRSTGTGIGVYSRTNNFPGFYFGAPNSGFGHRISSDIEFGWSSTSVANDATDLTLARDAANTLAQRNSTNAQTYRLYNTYTDASNYQRTSITDDSTGLVIDQQYAGTGAVRTNLLDLKNNGTSVFEVPVTGAVMKYTTLVANCYMQIKGSSAARATFGVGNLFGFFGTESIHPVQLRSGNVTRLTIEQSGGFTVADANDIAVGTTTGTKIGTATTQKIGFYNATPVVQPTAVADITTTATSGSLPTPDGTVTIADATTPTVTELLEYCVELEAKLEAALGHLRTLGLIAT